jgi:hypothetical protein
VLVVVVSSTPMLTPVPPAFENRMLNLSLCFSFIHSLFADHFADDLEVELEATMLDDFGAQLEDGSPREVRLKSSWFCSVATAARCVFSPRSDDVQSKLSPVSFVLFLHLRAYRLNEMMMLLEEEKARLNAL